MPWLGFLVILAALLGGLALLASRVRRSGVGRQVMGPVDMVFRPQTHELNREIQVREERMAERQASGDPRKPSPLDPDRQDPF